MQDTAKIDLRPVESRKGKINFEKGGGKGCLYSSCEDMSSTVEQLTIFTAAKPDLISCQDLSIDEVFSQLKPILIALPKNLTSRATLAFQNFPDVPLFAVVAPHYFYWFRSV